MRSSGSSLVSARGVVTSAAGPPSVEYEVTEGGGRREEEAKIFRRDRSVTRGATDGSQIAFNPNRERERCGGGGERINETSKTLLSITYGV